MSAIIAYCGLMCQTCPIYLATREDDITEHKRMRVEIARLCNEQYGMNYDLEDITDCDGCLSEGGRLFSGCKNCLIRACVMQHGHENCAWCSEYVCEKLEGLFNTDPSARTRLDKVRNSFL